MSLTTLVFVAEEGFAGWHILENGGDKWAVEGLFAKHPNEAVQKNFVTSYGRVSTTSGPEIKLLLLYMHHCNGSVIISEPFSVFCRMCKKSQLINLEEEGYSPSFMDNVQPDIKISDW